MSRLWRWIRDKMSDTTRDSNDEAGKPPGGDSGIAPPLNPLVAALAKLDAEQVTALKSGEAGPEQTALGKALRDLPELVTFSGLSAGVLPDPAERVQASP